MVTTVQVTIDAHEPHVLADWWADVLEWTVEWQDPAFIRRMIDEGHAVPEETVEYRGQLVWRVGAAIVPPEGVAAPRILFQEVPEGKSVKNRVHLDLRPSGGDLVAARERVVQRGAVPIGGGRQGPFEWVVYTDPEGNEFCL
jgi:hypothetical protein